jgi:hypothetical protein
MGLRGPKAKSAEYHRLRGTYRRDRHGAKPGAADAEAANDPWRNELRLPGIVNRPSPGSQRSLDPLEEILVREGIPLPASSSGKP